MDEILIRKPENPAKTYLKRYRALLARQNSLQRAIDAAYDRSYSCTARLKPVNVQGGSAAYDRMAEDVAKITDETEQLRAVKYQVGVALAEILCVIAAVPEEAQKTVLTLRYVEALEWADICKRLTQQLHCSERKIFILHGRALYAVNKWMEVQGIVGNHVSGTV